MAKFKSVTPKEVDEVVAPTIQKFELNDDTPAPEWAERPMAMDEEHRLQSAMNVIKILPPNMIKNGRHTIENVSAICGFKVSEEMLDILYKTYKHPDYD